MRGHQPANGWELGLDDTVPPSRRVHAHTHAQAKHTRQLRSTNILQLHTNKTQSHTNDGPALLNNPHSAR